MTVLAMLQRNALQWPDRPAYIYVEGSGRESWRLSWRQVVNAVAALAASLRREVPPGQTVLLICDPDPRFAIAMLACLSAELISVPLPPLDPARAPGQRDALCQIQADCGASLALSYGNSLRLLQDHPLPGCRVQGLPELSAWLEPSFTPEPMCDREDALACLLYTSGSTSAPKAVAIRARHLAFNASSCAQAWSVDVDSILISWMPNQHSFGLIYNVLIPLYSGCTLVAASPASFLARPRLWFELFSRYRGSHGAAAAFGYQYCNEQLSPDQLADLDLSSWEVGLISAEPVRRATCETFLTLFSRLGLGPDFFCPLYGLSECGPITSMAIGTATPFHQGQDIPSGLALACVGQALPSCTVRIVDPDGTPLGLGEIGEVWLQSPALMDGYFRRDAANLEVFAELPGTSGRWFRSGDQGFLDHHGLYITGRIKEILIVRGKNFYPQDIEWSALQSLPEPVRGAAAAFESSHGAFVFVLELHCELADDARYGDTAAKAIAQQLGISPDLLLVAAPGTIPKTASGKLRRGPCRQLWEDGKLPIRYERCGQKTLSVCDRVKTECFFTIFADVAGMALDDLDEDQALSAFDLDSLMITNLTAAVALRLGKELHPTLFYKCETLAELANALEAR